MCFFFFMYIFRHPYWAHDYNSSVLRSQSFHNGVGQFNNLQLRQQFSEDSFNKNCWTVMSTESSDGEEFGDHA